MKIISRTITAAFGLLLLGSCSKNYTNNGLETVLSPSFEIEQVTGRTNTYIVRNTTEGYISTRWNFDKGEGFANGKSVDTVFYPDAGAYSVGMRVMGKGGVFYDAPAQTITVATSDPVSGNLIAGGKMNPEDESSWTKFIISAGVNFNLTDGKMTATGGNWGHAAIYQKINVVAGKKYRFGMTVSGSGASDTWLEVFFGTTAPVPGADYSNGGNYIGMNTWNGCGNTSFSGNISTIGCSGSLVGKGGEVTFTTGGDKYLLIKTGGGSLGTTGMSVDNIELRGM
jgi:hypothetical protein